MKHSEKITQILLTIFVMVFSFTVLSRALPETGYVQNTIQRLEKSQSTIMKFSSATIATSLAMSALPNDFATPLAGTVSDLNTYFIFMFAVVFIEKLIVIEGTKLSLTYIIPAACILYTIFIITSRKCFKALASKLLILGISLVVVIPSSTLLTETMCADYLAYVDETIAEADAGANKVNDVMSSGDEDSSFFDKLSNAFKTAIQSVTDLLTYFKNVVKKCINSVAIMLVITFVVPLLILLLYRWLLNELFSLHLPVPNIRIRLPHQNRSLSEEEMDLISLEE